MMKKLLSMEESTDFQLNEDDIKKYFVEYVTESRNFLNEKYHERTKTSFLFTKYPFKIKIYFSERGISAYYKQEKEFSVEVYEGSPTTIGVGWNRWQSISSKYFPILLKKGAKGVAINDILSEIAHEESEEERQMYLAEQYNRFLEEDLEETINYFLKYTESSKRVLDETVEKNKNEVYSAIEIKNYHLYEIDFYLKAGLLPLFETFQETSDYLDSSIFLALHGRYDTALAVLRRFLETVVRSVYYDPKKAYDDFSRWHKEPEAHYMPFKTLNKKVIDGKTNEKASELFKGTIEIHKEKDFKEYVYHIFKDLSKHVHYGGGTPLEKWSLDFSQYDEELFLEWFSKFKQVKEICDYLVILKFPDSLRLFEEFRGQGFPDIPEALVNDLKKFYNTK